MSALDVSQLLMGDEGGYTISRSVRLRSSASAYFSRTFGTTGTSLYTRTFSFWVKRGSLADSRYTMFSGYDGSSSNNFDISFDSSSTNQNAFTVRIGGTPANESISTAVFRDPSAWYHFVVAIDTTQATAANRIKIYVNNTQITSFYSQTLPSQNQQVQFALANANNKIGSWWNGSSNPFDGYLTEINFIDGQALTPSSFGETDAVTGVWKPKKYAGTYGTNGFYLNFSDNSAATAAAIGKDSSGNGNNWTPNNISVTAGATYDSMIDTPTPYADGGNGRGNYAVLNPLKQGSAVTVSNGNLRAVGTGAAWGTVLSSVGMTSGKWYCEVTMTASSGSQVVGICQETATLTTYVGATSVGYGYYAGGGTYNNGVNTVYGGTYGVNNVIGIAYDADAGSLTFYKDGVSQGVAYSGLSTTATWFFAVSAYNTTNTNDINFGQRPFAYTPPTGFKALNTQNLSDSTIKKGNQYFDVATQTRTGVSGSVTGIGFQPDLVWDKARGSAFDHTLYDAVRGVQKELISNTTAAETTQSTGVTAFNSDGFSYGTRLAGSTPYVSWLWKKGATQGVDIVTFNGTSAAQNVSHSLGVAPAFIITKGKNVVNNWWAYHSALGGTKVAYLNLTNAAAVDSSVWNNTAPTSSVFTVGSAFTSGNSYVAYLFAEVAGFSKFGSYTGNGSTDGPFVFCGFRPRFILLKRSSGVENWQVYDTARDTYNASGLQLIPNTNGAEADGRPILDVLSNGFKLRNSAGGGNAAADYIFAAFAENPFKNSLAR